MRLNLTQHGKRYQIRSCTGMDRLKHFLELRKSGAWSFLVGGVICLVDSGNERGLRYSVVHILAVGDLCALSCEKTALPRRGTGARKHRAFSPFQEQRGDREMQPESNVQQPMLLSGVEHYSCDAVFSLGSRQQVCDALRCSGLHAHDTGVIYVSMNALEKRAAGKTCRAQKKSTRGKGRRFGVFFSQTLGSSPVLRLEQEIP